MQSWTQNATVPTITLGGTSLVPALSAVGTCSGFQAVVIDPADITKPENIRLNAYFGVQYGNGIWPSTYLATYEHLLSAILASGNPYDILLILASFGLDENMVPPSEVCAFLLEYAGAGQQLQTWMKTADPGSQNRWVGTPANYILVGFTGGSGYGGAAEELFQVGSYTQPVTTSWSGPLQGPPP
jgi:hypothetical protein